MKPKHYRIHQRKDMLFEVQKVSWFFFWDRIGERLFTSHSEARNWVRNNLILAKPIIINPTGDIIYHGF